MRKLWLHFGKPVPEKFTQKELLEQQGKLLDKIHNELKKNVKKISGLHSVLDKIYNESKTAKK